MFSSRRLTWSTLRYIRSQIVLCRTLFSRTGKWDKTLNQEVREELEAHWRPVLHQHHVNRRIETDLPKYYVLSMFPYPSGQLHMGHVRVYTISDAMARYHRMTGKQVIHPMGWDAFGLPAENAAIERGERPDLWTYRNIESMKKQLNDLGCSFDWEREYATCQPQYYRWTQYIFIKMFEAGLVYQKEAEVNWDPVDKTVLADEQISDTGLSWRSGAKVEKRYLRQWYIRTTAYAKSLWEGLDEVNSDLWKDITQMQRHWIGPCVGCRFEFKLKCGGKELPDPLSVFTDAPETVYGVSHICLSTSHRFNQSEYLKEDSNQDEKFAVSRITAVHPLTGKELPVIITSNEQFDEFNDSRLGIPSLNDEDKAIADQLHLSWNQVLENGVVTNSAEFSGLSIDEARNGIMAHAKEKGCGGHPVSGRLRDWLISRQRYWGTPIPVIHCPTCQAVPVPYSDLPVELPIIDQLSGRGASPLATHEEWLSVKCPTCGGPARRETDTMDTFVDSSWYFLRYLDPTNTTEPFNRDPAHRHMPVDLYIGGKEHAVLHLYFARFFNHFLHDLDLVPEREPFVNLLTQGMVMGQTYRVKGSGRYLKGHEVDFSGKKAVEKSTGAAVVVEWEKMSKSKHNGVDPQGIVQNLLSKRYFLGDIAGSSTSDISCGTQFWMINEVMSEFGVDSTRLCILSNVAPQSHRKWSNEVFKGIQNWQARIWVLVSDLLEQSCLETSAPLAPSADELEKVEQAMFEHRNYFLKEVIFHFEKTFLLSVAISRLQGLTNALKKVPPELMPCSPQFERSLCDLVIMVAPLAPHFAAELWAGLASRTNKHSQQYHWDKLVIEQDWPKVDENFHLPLILKVNHQETSQILLEKSKLETLTLESAHDLAKLNSEYQQYCAGREMTDIQFSIELGYEAVIHFTILSTGEKKERKDKKEKRKEKKEKKKKMKQP